ncbi:MAG: GNAT family acetyltransferase [Spirochaetia bacterium]
MYIRKYNDSDFQQVVRMWETVFHDSASHNNPQDSLNKKIAVNDGLLLVACDKDRIIGTVMGGYDGHRGWIYSLAVLQEYRSRGIGTELINSVEKELKNMGCLKVNLQVRETNDKVIQFYKKCGYTIEPRTSMGKKLY